MKWPLANELIFSLKSFAAGMLALFIAMRLGLPRPFWALITTYTLALPLSAAVRSKAIYRVIGTILGAFFVVLTVPRLVNHTVLLVLAFSLWVGFCLYISQFDRTARSYTFILAGYTTAIIGFPTLIDTSTFTVATIFDVASARVQEITLGIICATVVHSVFFPQSVGPVVLRRMDQSLEDALGWMRNTFLNTNESERTLNHRKLAMDITELRLMASHLPFDTSNLRWVTGTIGSLQDRLSEMLPLLSAIDDRLRMLRETGSKALPAEWEKGLADIVDWVSQGQENTPESAIRLRRRISDSTPVVDSHSSWHDILIVNLASELIKLVDVFEDCFYLRRQIDVGMNGAIPVHTRRLSKISALALHTDRRLALMSAFTAVIAISISCAFWVLTGWPIGFAAPMMTAISCTLFAAMDDPAPALMVSLKYTFYSSISSGIYLFYVFPVVHSYEAFMLAMAPFLIIAGIYMARPNTFLPAMILLLTTCATMTLKDMGVSDITTFFNSQVSQIVGVIIAVVTTRVLRSVSAEWTANRLLLAGWNEIVRLCEAVKIPSVIAVTVRMVDRISLLAPRLAATSTRNKVTAANALEDLRVGLNVAQLLRVQKSLEDFLSLKPLLNALSNHFRNRPLAPLHRDASLLELIDSTLHRICALPSSQHQIKAVSALVGIRRDLFPQESSYPSPDGYIGQLKEST